MRTTVDGDRAVGAGHEVSLNAPNAVADPIVEPAVAHIARDLRNVRQSSVDGPDVLGTIYTADTNPVQQAQHAVPPPWARVKTSIEVRLIVRQTPERIAAVRP